MLGEYGIYGQIRAILTAMFNSLMPSLNSRSLPFVVFLGGFPSRCQNLSSGAIRPGGLLFSSAVPSGSGAFQMPTHPSICLSIFH